MSEFNKEGVVAALTAANLKTLVKCAIKRAGNRTNEEAVRADLEEAKGNLALFLVRAELETRIAKEKFQHEIEELEEWLDTQPFDETEAGGIEWSLQL